MPFISIITVSFNSVDTIEQTILSVIDQDFKDYEYIIIDGGSTDGTIDIIKRYHNQISLWISEPDRGIYDAMNKGLNLAQGKFISLLNSDDWFEQNSLNYVANSYQLTPNVDIFHGLLKFIDINDEPDSIIGHYSSYLNKGMIEHPTCFIKKDLYDRVGLFDLNYKSASDYDWMLRASRAGAKFLFIPKIFTNFRRGGMSSSFKGNYEELLIKKQYGIISNFKFMFLSFFRYIMMLKNKL
jgi:glycosyltransferase involved in cell wall biosynthesis